MSAFAIATVESALRYWLVQATGLAEGEVIWMDQGQGHQPTSGRFLTLRPAGFRTLAPRDEDRWEPASPIVEGAELRHRAGGPRELGVYVQANSTQAFGGNSAFELIRRAQLGLELPAVISRLSLAGLSVLDRGAPRNVATLLDTRFAGRFSLDVRFNASDELISTSTYIQTVEGEGLVAGTTYPYSQTSPDIAED
jgi:hypothetical protein